MNKTIFYLSGLPRSGSTLLGSLIGQRPDFTVTPTSPFLDLLCYTDEAFAKEIEKCDIVCKSCHSIRTSAQLKEGKLKVGRPRKY